MEPRFHVVTPAEARATIAARLLPVGAEARLGEITLAPHQLAAARRLTALLAAHGGALLADDVGLGKTYVALAVARPYARVLVIAPAVLRGMWHDATSRAGVEARVTSYESLSRTTAPFDDSVAPPPPGCPDSTIVILDEAHHARTPNSRRYPRIAALTGSARTLLLTATPLHNRLNDLRSLVALFAGSRAWTMSEAALGALVYRRTAASVPGVALPGVGQPRWITVDDDSACLSALQRLPPPVPPSDGGHAGALVLLGLVRQWASSRAALIGALRRSLGRSVALHDSIATGRLPTAVELRTWAVEDDAMQLAFPELIAGPVAEAVDATALTRSLGEHCAAVTQLLGLLSRLPDPDADRARGIVDLQRMHPGEKIVCFTSFAETADAYWRRLRNHAGVARLSARGGEIASGRITRDAALKLFAPDGQRARAPGRLEEVNILITTDILSEGVDLRDATVVVHLDLPWSPARMEQRVGRARRMGSGAGSITVYTMQPPAPSEAVLAIERRLRQKVAIAARTVGRGPPVLPAMVEIPGKRGERSEAAEPPQRALGVAAIGSRAWSDAERRSALLDHIATWLRDDHDLRQERVGAVAAFVPAPVHGWLAVAIMAREPLLIASLGGRSGSDAALLARACDLAEGTAPDTLSRLSDRQLASLLEHAAADARRCAAERAAAEALAPGTGSVDEVPPRERFRGVRSPALARIDRALAVAPPHRAPRIATLAAAARHVVSGRLTAGLERRLDAITSRQGDDDAAWLEEVVRLAATASGEPAAVQLRVVIVFAPTSPSPA